MLGTVFLLLTSLLRAQSPAENLIPLDVQVVDGITAKPRASLEITLADRHFNVVAGPVRTDAQGKYRFLVKSGNYLLNSDGVYYGQLPDGFIQTIAVGKEAESITFKIFPPATVSGTVRDEWGDPAAASLQLYKAHWSNGRVEFHSNFSGSADDRGLYRIDRVPAGSYIVCAIPRATVAPIDGPVDFSAPPPPKYYQRACIPDLSAGDGPSTAMFSRLLRIGPGERRTVDLLIPTGRAHTIRGKVTGLNPTASSISIQLHTNSPMKYQTPVTTYSDSRNGEFSFKGVAAGSYTLRAQAEQGNVRLGARIPVRVSGDTEVPVTFEPNASLEATVRAASPKLALSVASLVLYEDGADDYHATAPSASGEPWNFERIPAGSYWLRIRTKDEGGCVVGARIGDQDVWRKPIILSAGTKARLVLDVSSECGVLRMRVMHEGKPVAAAKVVVLLGGTPAEPGDCYSGFSDPDGEFTVTGLQPGEYRVWAWPDDGTGSYVGPDGLGSIPPTLVKATNDDKAETPIPLLRRGVQ